MNILTKFMLGRVIWIALRLLMVAVFVGLVLWSIMAVYYSNLPKGWPCVVATVIYAAALIFVLIRFRFRWAARLICLAAVALVLFWFLEIPPSNDRDWQPDVAVLPYADVDGDKVTLHNIRNCEYRSETDYTPKYYDKKFDLKKLQSVDFFVVHWGSAMIAHTMLSFGFGGDDYVCISIETRKEKGEEYSAIKGFFRQYEIIYVVADERDLVRLRTNFRGEQVYLYRLNPDMEVARAVFMNYINAVNGLNAKPEWYNALTSNCTTTIRGLAKPFVKNSKFDWRILLNGYIDKMAYERKTLVQDVSFSELKARSLINDRAKAAGDSSSFSERIREGLPEWRRNTAEIAPGFAVK
jgi:hypothetical protein